MCTLLTCQSVQGYITAKGDNNDNIYNIKTVMAHFRTGLIDPTRRKHKTINKYLVTQDEKKKFKRQHHPRSYNLI